MLTYSDDARRYVELGVMDIAQIEHAAVLASQLGDTETESVLDDALAGVTSAEAATAMVHEDERYTEWMERGRLWGWETRQ